MRHMLIAAACLTAAGIASLVAIAPAQAQWSGPLWVGVPQYVSAETGVAFFFAPDAQAVDGIARTMAEAASRCDSARYEQALASTAALRASIQTAGETTANQYEPLQRRKDIEAVGVALDKAPRLPRSCGATTGAPLQAYGAFGPVQAYALGGALLPLSGAGTITGVAVGSSASVGSVTGGTATLVGMAGGRLRAERPLARETGAPTAFFETGLQSAFGAQSFIQTFGPIGPQAQGYGSSTVTENLQVPLLMGVSIPLTEITPATPVYLEVYGGVTLDSWTQTLQGSEGGAPFGGPGFFSQTQRFTIDPTVGAGFRLPLSSDALGFPLIFRAGAEFQFRPSGVVLAQSGQFGGQTYWGTVNQRVDATIIGGFGIPFGR